MGAKKEKRSTVSNPECTGKNNCTFVGYCDNCPYLERYSAYRWIGGTIAHSGSPGDR
jgi:hypothetical protein